MATRKKQPPSVDGIVEAVRQLDDAGKRQFYDRYGTDRTLMPPGVPTWAEQTISHAKTVGGILKNLRRRDADRRAEVFRLREEGKTRKQIAAELGIEIGSVDHVLYNKGRKCKG